MADSQQSSPSRVAETVSTSLNLNHHCDELTNLSPEKKRLRMSSDSEENMDSKMINIAETANTVSDDTSDTLIENVSHRKEHGDASTLVDNAVDVKDTHTDYGYEYLDHPADVQLHSWGRSMSKAMEQLVLSMYNYMTDLHKVEEVYDYHFTAKGRDMETLVFSLLEEPLVAFQSEPFFIGKRVEIIDCDTKSNFEVTFRVVGESFDLSKHSQETDVKAITYSNMQIHETDLKSDIYVIIDI